MYTVIYDAQASTEFESTVKPLLLTYQCHFVAFDGHFDANQVSSAKVMTWLGDEKLKEILLLASEQSWSIGFIAHPAMQRFYKSFNTPSQIKDSIDDIVNSAAIEADLLICNDKPVLSSVMLGDAAVMKPAAKADENIFSKMFNLLVLIFTIRHATMQQFTLTTAKDVVVKTAALGMALVYRPGSSEFTSRVIGKTQKDEASLHAVILAPRSMTQVFNYFFTRVLPRREINHDIPNYAGAIKTQNLLITGHQELDYIQDGESFHAEQINIFVKADALRLLTSQLPEKAKDVVEKESVRIAKIPSGQAISELCGRALPWIYHHDQEEVKETFVALKESSKTTEAFIVLMVLSVLLASLGLFTNSTPVIIGAMILAPLMAPIISLSMGLLRQNHELILDSSKTLGLGIFLALMVGVIIAWFTPLSNMNSEIAARVSPTLLDLGVAIFSGIAGAYASARSEVAKSLAGVAIAVALVPPLVVSAIGIGWWEWHIFWGAFLMFLTNLVGMVLAAAMTFLVLGFSPFHIAKKGLLFIIPFVILVSIPLVFAFNKMVTEQKIIQQLQGWQYQQAVIGEVDIITQQPLTIAVRLKVNKPLRANEIDRLKIEIEDYLQQPIKLEITQSIVR